MLSGPTPSAGGMGQRIRLPIELGVGHLVVGKRYGDRVRGASGGFRHHLVQAVGGVVADLGVVPRRLFAALGSVSSGSSDKRLPGSATMPSSSVVKCPAIRSIVASSKRSAL